MEVGCQAFHCCAGEALCLMCEEESHITQICLVDKPGPALSGPVGGIVSHVLDVDAVVLGDV